MKIDWSAPADNGASITSYIIEVKNASGAWLQNTVYCDGADSTVLTNTECTIPMSILRDSSTFNLSREALVEPRISAVNLIGSSDPSLIPSSTVSVQTEPAAPSGLASGANTGMTKIQVDWNALTTAEERGGSASTITSYHLEW